MSKHGMAKTHKKLSLNLATMRLLDLARTGTAGDPDAAREEKSNQSEPGGRYQPCLI